MSEESRAKALATAAAVLNYKNRSARMLQERLLEKGVAAEDAEYALEKLRGYGYLNDVEFALSAVRSGVKKGWGAARIKRKLTELLLDEETIEAAIAEYSTDEQALDAFVMASVDDITSRAECKKAADKLFRRGFSWEEINASMRRCRMEYEEN